MQVPSSSTSTDLAIAPAVSSPERSSGSDFGRSLARLAARHGGEAAAERDGIHLVTSTEQTPEVEASSITVATTSAPADGVRAAGDETTQLDESTSSTDGTVVPAASDDEVDVAVARSTQGPLRGALHAAAVAIGHGRRSAALPAQEVSSTATVPATTSQVQIAPDMSAGSGVNVAAVAPSAPDAAPLLGLMAAVQTSPQGGPRPAAARTEGEGQPTASEFELPSLPVQPILPVAATDAAIAAAVAVSAGAVAATSAALPTPLVQTTAGRSSSDAELATDGAAIAAPVALADSAVIVGGASSTGRTQPDATAVQPRSVAGPAMPAADTAVAQPGIELPAPSAHSAGQPAGTSTTVQPSEATPTSSAMTGLAAVPAPAVAATTSTAATTDAGAANAATSSTSSQAITPPTSDALASVAVAPTTDDALRPTTGPATSGFTSTDTIDVAAPTGEPTAQETLAPTEAMDAPSDAPRDVELPAHAPNAAATVDADEMVLRPVSQQAPLTTTAAASSAFTPAQTSALAARVEAAVEALRHAPPPREAVLDVDGIRVTVRLVGEVVHVSSDQLGGGGRDLGQALANRGLQLADGQAGDGTERQSQDQPQGSGRGDAQRSTAAPATDLTGQTRTARDAGVLL